mmetsp:Transcript_37884/g.55820  ORF Transcript_37884/g.55820 Transcript_37884/m.55820 type:complete len:161 (-) Transcript_37884:449-931(-)
MLSQISRLAVRREVGVNLFATAASFNPSAHAYGCNNNRSFASYAPKQRISTTSTPQKESFIRWTPPLPPPLGGDATFNKTQKLIRNVVKKYETLLKIRTDQQNMIISSQTKTTAEVEGLRKYVALNRNARKPKRANRGKRPNSRHRRRAKSRRYGNPRMN